MRNDNLPSKRSKLIDKIEQEMSCSAGIDGNNLNTNENSFDSDDETCTTGAASAQIEQETGNKANVNDQGTVIKKTRKRKRGVFVIDVL